VKKNTEQQVVALFVQAMRTALAIIDEKDATPLPQPAATGLDLAGYLKAAGRGAAAKLAKQIGAPTISVSQWRTGERQVPTERCPAIERATSGAVRCETLRPDVDWAVLRDSQQATVAPTPAPKAKSQKAAPGIYPAQSKYNPWRAYAWTGKKSVYLGQFPTVAKAKAAQKAYLAGQQPKEGTRVANHRPPLEVVQKAKVA